MEIYLYIGADSPDAAERMYTTFEERAESLLDHPRLGVRRPELARPARMLIEGAYLIFYKTHPDTDEGPIEAVEVMRVVQGSRDLVRIF